MVPCSQVWGQEEADREDWGPQARRDRQALLSHRLSGGSPPRTVSGTRPVSSARRARKGTVGNQTAGFLSGWE